MPVEDDVDQKPSQPKGPNYRPNAPVEQHRKWVWLVAAVVVLAFAILAST